MKKIFQILVIFFVSLSFLEIASRFLFKNEFSKYNRRIMLFSENKTFKNFKNVFIYKPNQKFKSMTIYKDFKTDKLVEEYSYEVQTNNAGLVQLYNLDEKKNSIFILGASETKGQGSSPWFYDVESSFDETDIQLINIGMIGTGPSQQKILFDYIKNKYLLSVNKVIVIFSSSYFNRTIWNFNEQQLSCLKKHINCIGTEGIYGFNFKNNDPMIFSQKVIETRKNNLNAFKASIKEKKYLQAIKEIAKKSYFINKLYLVSRLYKSENSSNENNFDSILKMKEDYSNKFYLIHMQSKPESFKNKMNESSILVRKWLKENDMIDKNYLYCKIPEDGFHKNDSHANKIGYIFLRKCVESLIYEK